ncbi:hypothetical protein BDV98DRAFT_573916 [Pterulicium gracile]|uniref:MYND-type domain-containing protein n=1 Tax=Pterulicium gracile TaxID=1884261 RepID=A0A5C3QHR0_9AGAR|nr:hypothetical protein BDV98DRAFT_573916 [Pterula gracilis]
MDDSMDLPEHIRNCPGCALVREDKFICLVWDTLKGCADTPPPICFKALSVYMKRLVLGRSSIVETNPFALKHKSVKKQAEQEEAFNLKKLAETDPDFIDCCVCFVFRYDDQATIIHRKGALTPCNCDMTSDVVRKMHDKFENAPEEYRDRPADVIFKEMWENIFRVVSLAVNTSRSKRLASASKSKSDPKRKDLSYQHLSAFLYKDATPMGRMCCAWYMATETVGALAVLLSVYTAFPGAFPLAVTSMDPEFLPFILNRLHHLVECTSKSEGITESVATEIRYLVLILTLPYGLNDDTAALFMGDHVETVYIGLHALYAAACDTPTSYKFLATFRSELIDSIVFAIRATHAKFPAETCLDPADYSKLGDEVDLPLNESGRCIPYWETAKCISRLQETVACSGPGCSKKKKKMMRCARCGVVFYCSPYCQKASWNDSPHPHKAICQHWTFLMHAWPILAGPTGVLSDPDFAENSKRFKFVADRFLRALVIEKGYTDGFMAAVLLQCVSG